MPFRNILLASLAALAAALGALTASNTVGPAPSAAAAKIRTTAPLVSGVLLDHNARPAAHAYIRAAVFPHQRNARVIRPRLLAETTTNSRGEFVLRGAIPAGKQMRMPNGKVQLELTAITKDNYELSYQVGIDPRPSARAAMAARAGSSPLARSTAAAAGQGILLQVGRGQVEPAETAALFARGIDPATGGAVDIAPGAKTAAKMASTAAPVALAQLPQAACGRALGRWKAVDTNIKRYVVLQRVTTKKHSRQTYTWDTSKNTDLQLAYVNSSGAASGGLSGSYTEKSGLGMSMTLGNFSSKVQRPLWRYYKYRLYCLGNATDHYLYFPHNATGGSRPAKSLPSWTCKAGTTVPVGSTTWVVKTSTVNWTDWFSIAGVTLDVKQSNSTTEKLTVKPDKREALPRLCGDTGDIIDANRVKELP